MTAVRWDKRTVASVLAALRYWQGGLQADDERDLSTQQKARNLMPDHFADGAVPLGLAELDELCEAINGGKVHPPLRLPDWNAERIRNWLKEKQTNGLDVTWGRLLDFINEAGFANDEYFHLTAPWDLFEKGRKEAFLRERVWEKARWVAAFWCVGGSEGYYVHVERLWYDDDGKTVDPPLKRDLILVGKFWDWERAQEAVNAVQYLVNSVW